MRVKNFSDFYKTVIISENSDMDFSMHTWGESGQEMQPPNSGFEGTSSEPMDYSAGYSGENPEDEPVILDDKKDDTKKKLIDIKTKLSEVKATISDLDKRIKKLESKSNTNK